MSDRTALIADVLEQIAVIGRELSAARQGPFGDIHLSRTQLDALFLLAHTTSPLTAGALAAALAVTPGAVTQLVAGLREHGLVEIGTLAEDGRVRLIELTSGARTQVDAFESAAVARLEPRFAGLEIADLTQLVRLLRSRENPS